MSITRLFASPGCVLMLSPATVRSQLAAGRQTICSVQAGGLGTEVVLIVHVLIPPASGVASDEELPRLVVHPDENGVGHSHEPVLQPECSEVQDCVTSQATGQDEGNDDLRGNPHPDDFISEQTLLEDGIPAGFPDDQVCYLLDHDADKESRVARPF